MSNRATHKKTFSLTLCTVQHRGKLTKGEVEVEERTHPRIVLVQKIKKMLYCMDADGRRGCSSSLYSLRNHQKGNKKPRPRERQGKGTRSKHA